MIKINLRSFFTIGLSATFCVFVSSCASMSKKECLSVDWFNKGLDDAMQGRPVSRVQDHADACQVVKVKPDIPLYESGHRKGARLFCLPDNGYKQGRAGYNYTGLCPHDLEDRFLVNYYEGKKLFDIENNIIQLRTDIDSARREIDVKRSERDRLYKDIAASNDEKDRKNKLRRVQDIDYEIPRLEGRISADYDQVNRFEHDRDMIEYQQRRDGFLR